MKPSAVRALSILSLVLLPSMARAGDPIAWRHYPPGAPVDEPSELEVSCGGYGTFATSLVVELPRAAGAQGDLAEQAEPGNCPGKAEACATEDLAIYPSPLLAKTPPSLAKAGGGWLPCEDGRCFTDRADLGGRPWVAVIDWDDLHGWSIGWTIEHLAGAEEDVSVVLFPLYSGDLERFSRFGATDLHVLVNLCAVAEIADAGHPPRLINMSFGRKLRDTDPTAAQTCDRNLLSCQIARVLRHLACSGSPCEESPGAPRTLAVAAAGNHRVPQFPAALPAVLPAGSLQLGKFRSQGKAEPSWETPVYEGAQAWLPGYGLCFEEERGHGWQAPPGTSYSAAVLSGWIASLPASGQSVSKPLSKQPWVPSVVGPSVHLFHGDRRYGANSAVQALMQGVLRPYPGACKGLSSISPDLLSHPPSSLRPVDSPIEGRDSFIEVVDDLACAQKHPAPTDRPCVPCIGVETARPPERLMRASKLADGSLLVIDRGGSAGRFGPEPGTELVPTEVYLRYESKFYRLDDTLQDRGGIVIEGIDVQAGDQPSLVYLYDSYDSKFWSSIPVLVVLADEL